VKDSSVGDPIHCGLSLRVPITLTACCVVLLLTSAWPQQSGTASGASHLAPGASAKAECDAIAAIGTPGSADIEPLVPTRIKLMPTRYRDLVSAGAGYRMSDTPLVAFNGKVFGPAGGPDDPGSYYLIPAISRRLRWPMVQSVDVFYNSVLLFALLTGGLGFIACLGTRVGKWVACAQLCLLTGVAYEIGDVYVFMMVSAAAIVPWCLYFAQPKAGGFQLVFSLLSGLIIGISDTIRAHSGTGALIFAVCILLFQAAVGRTRKVLMIGLLLAGMAVPGIGLRSMLGKRDAFLSAVCPSYPKFSAQHPLWHSVYIGLGFLRNEYVPGYDDTVAYLKAQSVSPGALYGSSEYNQVLKGQVFSLVRSHPGLVMATVAAKMGIIFFLLLCASNVGLLAAALYGKGWPIELAFWSAIGFNALFGVMVTPSPKYLLGLVSCAVLYSIVSIDFAIQRGAFHRLSSSIRGFSHVRHSRRVLIPR
jgi:hypothetical protein